MWQKFKKSVKKRWEEITSGQLFTCVASLLVMFFIISLVAWISDKDFFLVIGMCCLASAMLLIIPMNSKEMKEDEEVERKKQEEQKNKQIEEIKNIFDGRKKIEVKLSNKNQYPYYTEKFYNGLGNLIFLHMLVFLQEALQESSELKIYAELCEESELVLYIHADKEKKEYPEFPHELFIKYFEPVKD